MLIVLASKTLNSLVARPSPLSLASQHLHGNMYLIPLVGTATDSSSTNQQLSGVMPLWPSWWRDGEWNESGEKSRDGGGKDRTWKWNLIWFDLISARKHWINHCVARTASFNFLTPLHVRRQRKGDNFTSRQTVPDSHFHPLDLSYVSCIAHKVVHGASYKAFLCLWQVEPQTVRFHVIGANDDDVSPGCGAGIMVNTRG